MGITVIGIDPGVRTGIAVLRAEEKAGWRMEISILAASACSPEHLKREGQKFDLAVVEVPEAYPGSQVRVSDIIDLAFLSGQLLERVPAHKKMQVQPKKWKGQLPKTIHHERILKELPSLKELLGQFKKTDHEHIIDAAGLALYGIHKETENDR